MENEIEKLNGEQLLELKVLLHFISVTYPRVVQLQPVYLPAVLFVIA